jgi:hypothetical protein
MIVALDIRLRTLKKERNEKVKIIIPISFVVEHSVVNHLSQVTQVKVGLTLHSIYLHTSPKALALSPVEERDAISTSITWIVLAFGTDRDRVGNSDLFAIS